MPPTAVVYTTGDPRGWAAPITGGTRETAARTLRLFAARRSTSLEAAPARPHRGVDDRQRGGVGHREADAAGRPVGSAGRHDGAGRAELGVARLRDARGLLAPARGSGQAQDSRDDLHQLQRLPLLAAVCTGDV